MIYQIFGVHLLIISPLLLIYNTFESYELSTGLKNMTFNSIVMINSIVNFLVMYNTNAPIFFLKAIILKSLLLVFKMGAHNATPHLKHSSRTARRHGNGSVSLRF